MIDAYVFKKNATRFRKHAQTLQWDFALVRLLNVYAFANYGVAYDLAMQWAKSKSLPAAQNPPLFLAHAAEHFGLEEWQLLQAHERIPRHQTLVLASCLGVEAKTLLARAREFA